MARYEELGLEGLMDRRLEQASSRRAAVDEVFCLTESYRHRHEGWSAKHFYAWYQKASGGRSHTWVKNCLQEAGLRPKGRARGAHRQRQPRTEDRGQSGRWCGLWGQWSGIRRSIPRAH